MMPRPPSAPWIRRAFRLPTTAARARKELDAELGFHLQERMEELMATGMDRGSAEREARRRFGNLDEHRRRTASIDERILRRRERTDLLDAFAREVRHASRSLARSPSFTLVAVLTLAIGVGATTAIFTLLDRVVLRPLPYASADRLVDVRSAVSGRTTPGYWGVSVAGYFEYRRHNRTFEHLGAFEAGELTLTGEEGAERVGGAAITTSMVRVLTLRPALGRLFNTTDDRPGAPVVAVLGHALWERRYGGDPTIVGKIIHVDGEPATVIGVMNGAMQLPDQQVDLWLPLALDSLAPAVNDHSLQVIGRLRSGVSAAVAARDLASLTSRFPELFPSAYSRSFMSQYHFAVAVIPTRDEVLGNVGQVLWMLLASVGLVLLIACANVANLHLVRRQARRREVAMRCALGASRAHLACCDLAESLLLAAVAGALALLLAWSGIHALLAIAPSSIPRLSEVHLDAATVLFAASVSLVIGVVFGVAPSLRRTEIDLARLREGARGATSSRAQLAARDVLVVAQVALALVLLATAGVLLHGFRALRDVRPGFDPNGVLTLDVALPNASYRDYAAVESFQRRLHERLSTMPGVLAVGATQSLPLDPSSRSACALVFVEDRPLGSGEAAPCLARPLVSPTYFAAMRIPLRGRAPTWIELEQHTAGVVVSEALARHFWPGERAIGKSLNAGGSAPFYRVVGVAGDVRGAGLDQPPPEVVYYPLTPITGSGLWGPPTEMRIVVRTRADHPEALTSSIRRAIADLDRNVPIANVQPMSAVVAKSMARVSFATLLLGLAAGMALLLSAIGIYGVIAYVVSQRRSEIGVRIALGARPSQVSGRIVLQALRLGAAGAVLGVAGALAAIRVLHALLAGIAPWDPRSLILASTMVLAVVALASFWPALRAASVSPVEALRAE